MVEEMQYYKINVLGLYKDKMGADKKLETVQFSGHREENLLQ